MGRYLKLYEALVQSQTCHLTMTAGAKKSQFISIAVSYPVKFFPRVLIFVKLFCIR